MRKRANTLYTLLDTITGSISAAPPYNRKTPRFTTNEYKDHVAQDVLFI